MPKRIPVKLAQEFAAKTGCRQVVIAAWDGELTHIVTYGTSVEDCAQAAEGGNFVKKAMGWPEAMCNGQPSRVRALQARIKELEAVLESQ